MGKTKTMKDKKGRSGGVGVVKMGKDKVFPPFEDKCWYKAKFKEFDTGEGKFGPLFFLRFEALAGEMEDGSDAKGNQVQAIVSQDLTPKSKLYEFVLIFEGRPLEEEDVIDLEAYLGKKVLIFIENSKKEKDDGTPYQNVTALKVIKGKKSKGDGKKKKKNKKK